VSSFRSTSVFNTANFSGAKLSKSCKFRDVLRVNKTQVVLGSKSVAILRANIRQERPHSPNPGTFDATVYELSRTENNIASRRHITKHFQYIFFCCCIVQLIFNDICFASSDLSRSGMGGDSSV
jgi:hypothetical protein